MQQIYSNTQRGSSSRGIASGKVSDEDLLKGFTFNADEHNKPRNEKPDSYADQMKLFRDQVSVRDSMQQAYTAKANGSTNPGTNDEDFSSGKNRKTLTNNFDKNHFDPSKDSSFKPLPVKRDRGTKTGFNTLQSSKP